MGLSQDVDVGNLMMDLKESILNTPRKGEKGAGVILQHWVEAHLEF